MTRPHIMKVPLDGSSKPVSFGPTDQLQGTVLPSYSPDGRWVAAVGGAGHDVNSGNAIVILDAADGTQRAVYPLPADTISGSEGGRVIAWAPDGSGVLFIRHTEEVGNLWLQPVDTAHFSAAPAPREITHYSSGDIFSIAFSPDGKDLAISRGHFSTDAVLISHFR